MTTLHRPAHDYGLTLILGGAEGSLWDLTGIYAGLARTVNRYFAEDPAEGPSFFPPEMILSKNARPARSAEIFLINPVRIILCGPVPAG
jgi:penicillin-binding protein 1C